MLLLHRIQLRFSLEFFFNRSPRLSTIWEISFDETAFWIINAATEAVIESSKPSQNCSNVDSSIYRPKTIKIDQTTLNVLAKL